ncbi:hypothetical protein CIK05_05450 [Bdellovibrio sp. qaytius]|nr:hypothetical protein CIK05_05450 [Bdellovibrio sp. qaytius]
MKNPKNEKVILSASVLAISFYIISILFSLKSNEDFRGEITLRSLALNHPKKIVSVAPQKEKSDNF